MGTQNGDGKLVKKIYNFKTKTMRKTTLDQLAECKWELEEVKTEAQEYKLYKKIITKLFPRQHERIVDEIKKKIKERNKKLGIK